MPWGELALHGFNDSFEESKVAIVETEAASEFPDSLDGVEFGAVGRQKMESESGLLLLSPSQVQARTMVLGMIADHDDAAAMDRAGLPQEAQKLPKAFTVESAGFAAIEELAVSESYRAEVSHTAPGGVMIDNGIFDFRRNPQATARAVLLKVHFVQRPHIGARISH